MPWAIDAHIHPNADPRLQRGRMAESFKDTAKYFRSDAKQTTIDDTAEHYRRLEMLAFVLALDSESGSGRPAVPNDFVADAARRHPDVFVGFGSVDPWKGKLAIDEVHRVIQEHGLKGFKFHPITQSFDPSDPQHFPIWEAIERYEAPCIFHSGTTAIGGGLPGGNGFKLRYGQPILVDDIAARFPGITFVLAHPAWPWADESLAMAVHKANVFIDLSGWSPKYFPESVIRYANTLLKDKMLFGSDYPFLTPERWLSDFEKLEIRPEVRPKLLFENAKRVFKLDVEQTPQPAALQALLAAS